MRKKVEDKMYRIVNVATLEERLIKPKALESCMLPGTFQITPIVLEENELELKYEVEDTVICVKKKDIRKGSIVVKEEPFVPQVFRQTGGCKPCTNCGRCSW
ncbi:MAG: hypothetical protein Q4D51_10025 [Eubacteriales bacterium]|nr:hypothetical protein [Eubacteriales bacterium]